MTNMTNSQAINYFNKGDYNEFKSLAKLITRSINNGFLTWEKLISFVSKKQRENKMGTLSNDIKNLLIEYDYFNSVTIYYCGKCIDSNKGLIEGIEVADYLEYSNSETLSMSFEGSLYQILNYGGDREFMDKFNKLINDYGYYYDFGNSWNISLYEA